MGLKIYYIKYDHYIVTIETDESNIAPYNDTVVVEMDATYYIQNDNFKIISIHNINGTHSYEDFSYKHDEIKNKQLYPRYVFMTYERAFYEYFKYVILARDFPNGFAGIVKGYYLNGILKIEEYIRINGDNIMREGIMREWYENGILCRETVYVDGLKEGIERHWYDTGALYKEITYMNDKIIMCMMVR